MAISNDNVHWGRLLSDAVDSSELFLLAIALLSLSVRRSLGHKPLLWASAAYVFVRAIILVNVTTRHYFHLRYEVFSVYIHVVLDLLGIFLIYYTFFKYQNIYETFEESEQIDRYIKDKENDDAQASQQVDFMGEIALEKSISLLSEDSTKSKVERRYKNIRRNTIGRFYSFYRYCISLLRHEVKGE